MISTTQSVISLILVAVCFENFVNRAFSLETTHATPTDEKETNHAGMSTHETPLRTSHVTQSPAVDRTVTQGTGEEMTTAKKKKKRFRKNKGREDGIPWQEQLLNWTAPAIKEVFEKHKIIPDVIDDAPGNVSKILFPLNTSPEFGNTLNITILDHIDWAQWPGTMNETFTLIHTAPDVPSQENPTQREYQIWVVGNILGPIYIWNQTLTEYVQVFNANGTGLHRYVFLVYKQDRHIEFDEPFLDDKNPKDPRRYHFSTRKFVEKYKLGKPFAGNFFYSY